MLVRDEISTVYDGRAYWLGAQIANVLGHAPDGTIEHQITRLAAAYVALTTARADRVPLAKDDALWALWRHWGEQYPPALVDALIEVVGRT